MKIPKVIIVILLTFFSKLSSQYNKENIFLEVPLSPYSSSYDSNESLEIYRITEQECNDNISFSVDENKKLIKNIIIKSYNPNTLEIVYNKKNNNKQEEVIVNGNLINYQDLVRTNLKNIISILNEYNNIYIIDNKKNIKKVTVKLLDSF
ncbi:hypothetical protein [Chryseobacterium sp. RR2-3-20]|uniref:hypothetical protein n=1 Tax=Chryseobacterium sp. RR2-3-20 TaxID=2787626 RepID=UPI001ADF3242|nr:hypothetical protein [Chryseobacterium sp. RR2-3-20]